MEDSFKILITFLLGAITGSTWRWLFKTIRMTWKTEIETETRIVIAVSKEPTETLRRELAVWAAIINEYFSQHKN